MEDDFTKAVEDGLRLGKRVCYSKDRNAPPRPAAGMDRMPPSPSLLPTAPTLYAVIVDPGIVDNPDIPSYQPHVHGRLDPPALIPLQMNAMALEIECCLDAAHVTATGSWRVHCVMGSKRCDCRLVVPMGEQGSILGAEIDVAGQSHSTLVVHLEEDDQSIKVKKDEAVGLMKPHMFSLTIPEVRGGSSVTVKVHWIQKLVYKSGEISIQIPFNFADYVNPFGKHIAKREKIKLNVTSAVEKEILFQTTSHALKEIKRDSGSFLFSYEADVLEWSSVDFFFSYNVISIDPFGVIFLQSPSIEDYDQREMFTLYLCPGSNKQKKVFRKAVVFLIDISESMRGRTLESVMNAVLTAVSELNHEDSFSIIAFNDDIYCFSSSLVMASTENIEKASQWINTNFVAGGGTNIMRPLNEAVVMLSKNSRDSICHIFLVTDGSVEDERSICSSMMEHVTSEFSSPRISTFGLGSFCNHYFLQKLATASRGQYDAAFDADSVETRMQNLFRRSLSTLLADITLDAYDCLNDLEVYPFPIPDLLWECPFTITGHYRGEFPDIVRVKGILPDNSNHLVDLNVKQLKDISFYKVLSKQQIDFLTSQAWLLNNKEFEEKVIKLSKQSGLASEYTHMKLQQIEETEPGSLNEVKKNKHKHAGSKHYDLLVQGCTSMGFGNVYATTQNLPTGFGAVKMPETNAVFEKAVGCCNRLIDCCCCVCFIKCCSSLNDKCLVALTQLCGALSCLGCYKCCSELCCCCNNE